MLPSSARKNAQIITNMCMTGASASKCLSWLVQGDDIPTAPHETKHRRVMGARAKFTQADIKRAFAGAIAAGISAPKVQIDTNGNISIIAANQNRPAKDDESWGDLD